MSVRSVHNAALGESEPKLRIGRVALLNKAERYSRSGLITKAGFATMPGEKEPANGVAEACSNILVPGKS